MPGAQPDYGLLKVPSPVQPTPAVAAKVATYATLNQTHPEYNAALLCTLDDLYEGGFRMQRAAAKYAPKMGGEHDARYASRCSKTAYLPYFAQIVNEFVSDLFQQPLTIGAAADADDPSTPGTVPDKEFYDGFAKDVDTRRKSLSTLLGDVLTTALSKRWGLVQLDAPKLSPGEPEPASLAEEKAKGSDRVYAYEIPVDQLIDWKVEGDGFSFCVVRTKTNDRKTALGRRDTVTETWMVWELDDGGAAVWSKYEISYPEAQPPPAEKAVPLVDEGTTSFKRIPILRLELTHGLWVGNKIGPLAIEHFSRRCELVGAESDSCYAIPVVKLASEIGAQGGSVPSEAQQDPNRGRNPVKELKAKGWMTVGAEDTVEYVEPSGGCYEVIDKQLDGVKDAMFSVSHQMAASVRPTAGSMGRSGLSKREDGKSTAKVLNALGEVMRVFGVLIYATISDARGDDVVWQAHGLDSYEVDDRESVLEEAISIDQVAIPSETFKRTHKFQVAKKLLSGVDPDTLAAIKAEIEAGVSAEMAHNKLAAETEEEQLQAKQKIAKDQQKNGLTPPAGPPVPGAKAPQAPPAKSPKAPAPPNAGGKLGSEENRSGDDVPVVKQRALYTCGIACLRSALLYFDLPTPGEDELTDAVDVDPKIGVEPAALMRAARDNGLTASAARRASLGQITSLRDAGAFVVLLIQSFDSPADGYDEGHYVAFQGVDGQMVELMDPDSGKIRRLDKSEFVSRWHGVWDRGVKVYYPAIVLRRPS